MSVLFRFTDSDYPSGIFKLCLICTIHVTFSCYLVNFNLYANIEFLILKSLNCNIL